MIKRIYYQTVINRLKEPRMFIQVLLGPRQIGKSTLIDQVTEDLTIPYTTYQADAVPGATAEWISDIWESERMKMATNQESERLLVIDEIQKLTNWSEFVKKEWDRDSREKRNLKVVILGSSRLLIQKGLTESLSGRYELIRMGHWTLKEMNDAFGFDIDEYIYFGGYPGTAPLISDETRWKNYMRDSIIEAAISKDVLMTTNIYKPVLLRQLFELGCFYSGEMISLNKILGQLQDAGNVTTLANYLHVLDESKLLVGLQKYANDNARKYSSIPKFQVYNNALRNAYSSLTFEESKKNREIWGRLTESAIGAYLVGEAESHSMKIYYWREKSDEVDFVLEKNQKLVGIEVKSGKRTTNKGLQIFREQFKPQNTLVVGSGGLPVEDFLKMNVDLLF